MPDLITILAARGRYDNHKALCEQASNGSACPTCIKLRREYQDLLSEVQAQQGGLTCVHKVYTSQKGG